MATLVTGATGFLGRHLLPLLAERGDDLRALVREGTATGGLRELGVEVVTGDLLDGAALKRAATGCNRVFHLAGVVRHARHDLARLQSVNVDGTRSLVAAVEPGARVVHVSSVAAVGPAAGPGRPAGEEHPFPPYAERYLYSRTKRAAEQVMLEAARQGLEVVVANPGFLIGPGDTYRVSTWPVWRYLQGTLRITVPGGLSYVDARDVAVGLVALDEQGRAGERTILTSMEGNLSHAEFFQRIGEVTGVRRHMFALSPRVAVFGARLIPWPVHPDEVAAAANWWFYDPGKAERELGFTTRPLDETIAETAADYL